MHILQTDYNQAFNIDVSQLALFTVVPYLLQAIVGYVCVGVFVCICMCMRVYVCVYVYDLCL